jgi:hypothetical protein
MNELATSAFNPDGITKFTVVIIYEDIETGKRTKHFYDRVARALQGVCDLSLKDIWNFQVIAISEICYSEAQAAAQPIDHFITIDLHSAQIVGCRARERSRKSGTLSDI